MTVEYILDPSQINLTLSDFPNIKKRIDTNFEDEPSSLSYPHMKKSKKLFYAFLGKKAFSNLSIKDVELCLSNGYDHPELFETTSYLHFDSYVSEVIIASHFFKLGLPANRPPDIHAKHPDISLITSRGAPSKFEVYTPTDWIAYEYLKKELCFYFRNIDVPLEYKFNIKIELIKDQSEDDEIAYFNPHAFSSFFNDKLGFIQRIDQLVKTNMMILSQKKKRECLFAFQLATLNCRITIQISDLSNILDSKPIRPGQMNPPLESGHVPEAMFKQTLRTGLWKKIHKGQAKNFFVDISRLPYADTFKNHIYLEMYMDTMEEVLLQIARPFELIIFFEPNKDKKTGIGIPILFTKNAFNASIIDKIRTIIGPESVLEKWSDHTMTKLI